MLKKLSLICSLLISLLIYLLVSNKVDYEYKYLINIWIIVVGFIGSFLLLTLINFLFISFYSLFVKKQTKRNKINMFLYNLYIKYIMDLAGIKVNIEGLDKLPNKKAMVICNHRSNFDPMVIGYYLKNLDLVFVSKPENFKIPVCGRFIKSLDYISLDRSNARSGLEVIHESIDDITSDKYSVCIFPEGTRNKTKENLLDFHHGTFKIALKSSCPIVISSLENTNKVKHNFPFKRTIVNFKVVDVIDYCDYKDLTTKELSDKCYNILSKSLQKEEN